MALVDMKKVILVAHSGKKDKILKALHRFGLIEIVTSGVLENTDIYVDEAHSGEIARKLMRLESVLNFMRSEVKDAKRVLKKTKKTGITIDYVPEKKPLIGPDMARVPFDRFFEISAREEELFSDVSDLEEVMSRYAEINARKLKLKALNDQLSAYDSLDCKFSELKNTAQTTVIAGHIPVQRALSFAEATAEFPYAEIKVFEADKKFAPVVAVVANEFADELNHLFNEYEFARLTFDSDKTASEMITDNLREIAALNTEKYALLEQSVAKENRIDDLKLLYDFYLIEKAKSDASEGFRCTKSSFVLEGWVPAPDAGKLEALLEKLCDEIYFEIREPLDDELQPTLVKSNNIVKPYEDVTNMYSSPLKGTDLDPNPIMSFFYFLLFGMMLGDAGYGLILAIGGFVLYKLKKPTPGKGGLILIIAMGGISTFIWGVLYGSWFSIELAEGSFLKTLAVFDPVYDPITLLVVCYVIGIIHILTGMMMQAYDFIRKGQIYEAIRKDFTWLAVFIGLGLLVVNMLLKPEGSGMKIASLVFLGLGVGGLLLLGGNGKNPLKRLSGGLGQLYNGVNIFSDVLSYSRLFGLGIATAVIGMVINKIVMVLVEMLTFGGVPVGWIVGIPILLIGHVFNLGINTLGTYVHNCRLQYIEFFGKFYTGGGHQFVPFASRTKYTYIELGLKASEINFTDISPWILSK